MISEVDEVADNVVQLNLSRELYSSSSSHFIGIFSPKSKQLLTRPEAERTGATFLDLLAEMENIDFFKMFSSRTKESLAKKLSFVTRRADQVLLVQGRTDEPQQALYVIMSGVVTELYRPGPITIGDQTTGEDPNAAAEDESLKSTDDQSNGKSPNATEDGTNGNSPMTTEDRARIWPEKILRKGEFFGHVDLVYDRPPTVDAQTVGYCELLMLSKEDFGIVRKELEALCMLVGQYLRTTAAIGRFGWSEEEYKVLEIYSKLCTYAENQHVYGGASNKRQFWSYFVVSGECRIVRKLSHRKAHAPSANGRSNREAPASDKVASNERLTFEEAKQGYFFGVGESFGGNHVIASSTLECLLVPRLVLVFKNRELLQTMARDLTNSLPSDQEVLDCHSKLIAASKKKVDLLKGLFKEKPSTSRFIEN